MGPVARRGRPDGSRQSRLGQENGCRPSISDRKAGSELSLLPALDPLLIYLQTMVYDLQVNMLAAGLTVPIIPPIMPPIVSPMQIVARFETSEERNEVIAITTAALAKIKTELAQVEEAYRDWLAASRAEQEVPLL